VERVHELGVAKKPLFKTLCSVKKSWFHGLRDKCPAGLKSGTTCKLKCEPGYTLNKPLKCYDGVLNNAQCVGDPCKVPRCLTPHPGKRSPLTLLVCSDLQYIPANHGGNGNCLSSMKSGTVCTPSCQEGYDYVAKEDRVWVAAQQEQVKARPHERACMGGVLQYARCRFTGCVGVQPPKNGRMGDCKTTLADGYKCTPTCNEGYLLKQRYMKNGKLTGKAECRKRVFTPATCIPGPCYGVRQPLNGHLGNCPKHSLNNKKAIPVGAVCTYGCDKGYHPKNKASCFAGEFQNVECIPDPCKFAPPKHGSPGKCPKVLGHGKSCSPGCNQGYSTLPRGEGTKYSFLGRTSCKAGKLKPSVCDPDPCKIKTPKHGERGDCPPFKLKSGSACKPGCNEWFKASKSSMSCFAGQTNGYQCVPIPWVNHGKCTSSREGRKGLRLTCSKTPKSDRFKFVLEATNVNGVVFKTVIPTRGTSLLAECQRYRCMGDGGKVEVQTFKKKDCTGGLIRTEVRTSPMSHKPGIDGMRLVGRCVRMNPAASPYKVKVERHDGGSKSCESNANLADFLGYNDYLAGECMTEFNPNNAKVSQSVTLTPTLSSLRFQSDP